LHPAGLCGIARAFAYRFEEAVLLNDIKEEAPFSETYNALVAKVI
jgi:hypothetical protein